MGILNEVEVKMEDGKRILKELLKELKNGRIKAKYDLLIYSDSVELVKAIAERWDSLNDSEKYLFIDYLEPTMLKLLAKLLGDDKISYERIDIRDAFSSKIHPDRIRNETLSKFEYDIALSFAGEDREIAEEIANALGIEGVKVFYDQFHKIALWGKKLTKHFSEVYGPKTKFVMPLISKHYPIKDWTDFEFSIARREAKKRTREFILPVKLDGTKVVGIHEDVLFLDYKSEGTDGIVDAVLTKLARGRKKISKGIDTETIPYSPQIPYDPNKPPGAIHNRVFVGGNYDFMPLLREICKTVFDNGYQPIFAYDFEVPKDEIHDHDIRLLHNCKYAIFEVSNPAGELMEIERVRDWQISTLLIYQIRDKGNPTPPPALTSMLKTFKYDRLIMKGFFSIEEMKKIIISWLKNLREEGY